MILQNFPGKKQLQRTYFAVGILQKSNPTRHDNSIKESAGYNVMMDERRGWPVRWLKARTRIRRRNPLTMQTGATTHAHFLTAAGRILRSQNWRDNNWNKIYHEPSLVVNRIKKSMDQLVKTRIQIQFNFIQILIFVCRSCHYSDIVRHTEQ